MPTVETADPAEARPLAPSRRAVVLGVGGAGLAVALTACTGYNSGGGTAGVDPADPPGQDPPAGGTEPTQAAEPTEEATAAGDGGGDAPAANAFAKTADIPEGSGKIFESDQIVITQPSAGQFKAFTAVCTHQGCTVGSISNGTINCPCHGSKFKITDGSVAGGPAKGPLREIPLTVSGDSITLA
ncbi:Rieske (2Fe-2S) protein [Acrocarpospora catenulata]|uniref:Rieske (2Fe-2S) protein n=1 Tax=Acrocarpospora catenulata TaxID=2836182 RepID=UPI00202392A8|nr:Rieske (2Fe-2S) protein [Acrocarpospora catenulata]